MMQMTEERISKQMLHKQNGGITTKRKTQDRMEISNKKEYRNERRK